MVTNEIQQQTQQREIHFWERGCQNYIAGRFAFLAGLHPIAGNQLHHAIEFFLKGALSKSRTLDDLRQHLHRLTDLWAAFKAENANTTSLARFDAVVATLHAYWDLRYPDDVLKNGMELTTSTFRQALPPDFRSVQPGMIPADIADNINQRLATLPKVKRYEHLCLQEVDELVEAIFAAGKRNPSFFFHRMSLKALETLADGNLAAGLLK